MDKELKTVEELDFEQAKLRAPVELIITKLTAILDEQQNIRRSIETLIGLKKILSSDKTLLAEVDSQLLNFVKALKSTTLTSDFS